MWHQLLLVQIMPVTRYRRELRAWLVCCCGCCWQEAGVKPVWHQLQRWLNYTVVDTDDDEQDGYDAGYYL
jgi:hypothetical protein